MTQNKKYSFKTDYEMNCTSWVGEFNDGVYKNNALKQNLWWLVLTLFCYCLLIVSVYGILYLIYVISEI
jgi:hypothetical protein